MISGTKSRSASVVAVLVLSLIVGILLSFPMSAGNGGRITVVLISSLTLVFSLFVAWRSVGYTLFPSPTLIFILLTVLLFIGSLLLFWERRVGSELAILTLAGSSLFWGVGVLFANSIRNFKPRIEVINFLKRPIVMERNSNRLVLMVIVLAVISIIGSFLYYQGFPPIVSSIEAIVSGDEMLSVQRSLSLARGELTKGHLLLNLAYRGQGILRLLWIIVLPYVALFCVVSFIVTKRRRWSLFSIFLLTMCILFLIGTGERSRIVWVMAIFSFAGFFIQGRWLEARQLRWVLIAIVGYISLTVLLGHTGTDLSINALLENLWKRLINSQAYNTVSVFELIPQYRSFYYGEILWAGLVGLLPGPSKYQSFSYQLAQLQGRSSQSLTYASSSIYSTTYADFGVLGVIIGSFFIGFILQAVTIKLMRLEKTVNLTIFFAFLSGYLSQAWLYGTLVSPFGYIVPIFGVYYFLHRTSMSDKRHTSKYPAKMDVVYNAEHDSG